MHPPMLTAVDTGSIDGVQYEGSKDYHMDQVAR